MRRSPKLVLAGGWAQALVAVLLVATAAGVIAVSSWSRSQTAGRLAILGVALFVLALIIGSGLLVGLTTLPLFAAALVSTPGGGNPAWARVVIIGAFWYLAAELGWDAIERRDGVRRTKAYNQRRIDEANTVILLTVGITATLYLISSAAPIRTVFVIGAALLGVAAALALAAQRLRDSGDEATNRET